MKRNKERQKAKNLVSLKSEKKWQKSQQQLWQLNSNQTVFFL